MEKSIIGLINFDHLKTYNMIEKMTVNYHGVFWVAHEKISKDMKDKLFKNQPMCMIMIEKDNVIQRVELKDLKVKGDEGFCIKQKP
ncbi:hypothetical protein HXX01_03040 [Candidatus Nomurabacteria bacterium]|nr:hypothetical protein [Candidatus Nomurabacteria bacterium]